MFNWFSPLNLDDDPFVHALRKNIQLEQAVDWAKGLFTRADQVDAPAPVERPAA